MRQRNSNSGRHHSLSSSVSRDTLSPRTSGDQARDSRGSAWTVTNSPKTDWTWRLLTNSLRHRGVHLRLVVNVECVDVTHPHHHAPHQGDGDVGTRGALVLREGCETSSAAPISSILPPTDSRFATTKDCTVRRSRVPARFARDSITAGQGDGPDSREAHGRWSKPFWPLTPPTHGPSVPRWLSAGMRISSTGRCSETGRHRTLSRS